MSQQPPRDPSQAPSSDAYAPPTGQGAPPQHSLPQQPQPAYGQQPVYGQPQYQQPQYQQPAYGQQRYPAYQQPPVYQVPLRQPRPPLTSKAKRGAMLAGALGFTLMTIGFTIAMIPLAIAMIVALFASFFGFLTAASTDREWADVMGEWFGVGIEASWLVFVIFVVIGIVIWVLGYLVSILILKGHGIERRAAITWSGLGIAVVVWWLVSTVITPFSGILVPVISVGNGEFNPDGAVGVGIVLAVLAVVLAAGLGLLSWWWMAHAMRPRPETDQQPPYQQHPYQQHPFQQPPYAPSQPYSQHQPYQARTPEGHGYRQP
ncbi:hypothetical protein [Okibacterium endophyticum]